MLVHIGMRVFRQFIGAGCLTISIGDGKPHRLDSGKPGPDIAISLDGNALFWQILRTPDLSIGEAYMDGRLKLLTGTLEDFMIILMASNHVWMAHWLGRLSRFFHGLSSRFGALRHRARARRDVAHHYDLSDALFDVFLDPRRQYSCAYFHHPDDSLADAQITKLARIGAKLCLAPGQRILDVGCGWGGLANALWEMQPNASVTRITLSKNQKAYAAERAQAQNRDHHLQFHLRDFRDQTGTFDRIVSVGMLEHVGSAQLSVYFASIARLLAPQGLALVHAIGVNKTSGRCNRWLDKYIFPGGYLPSLEQMMHHASLHNMRIIDVEIMRGHYAETLRHWRQRFQANIDFVRRHYDERFIRMWEFYLIGCEYFFRNQDGVVFQLQLAHDYNAAPLTRRYISENENSYRETLCHSADFGKTHRLNK